MPTKMQTWITWGTALKPINVFIATCEIKKLAPSPQPPTSLQGKKICMSGLNCNHTQGQVSGSMNADPIDMVHISQESTKEGLDE